MSKASNTEWQQYYDYLDALRESGHVNMLGGALHLQRHFHLSKDTARQVLSAWMKEFSASKKASKP